MLELLEDRTLLSVSIASTNNNGQGFAALSFNQSGGYVPPDTNGAAGPSKYVETVNQTVALYGNKATGTPLTTASFSTFWFTTGLLPHADSGSSLSDPVITYNDAIGRFIVGDQDVNFTTHVSRFDVAVSKTSSPATLGTADWTFYSIVTTETGFDADYPGNFGYNHDATVITLNMFGVSGGGHVQVVAINNTDMANNVTQANLHVFKNDLADFAVRPATMRGSVAGDPMWMVTEHGDNVSIDVIKVTNVLSTLPTFTYTNLPVTAYSPIVNPLNPNGTVITNNIDARIQKVSEAALSNGQNVLVAAHSVSISATQDVVQWYEVNVTATPTLQDQGRVSGGPNTYLTYPAIDINTSGTIGLTYEKSGTDTSTDFLSVNITGRTTSDAAGTMETPVVVPAGTGQANYHDFSSGGRSGDLSGINIDPVDGSFWATSEFANTQATANWGTAVANFTISSAAASTTHYSVSAPASATAGAPFTITVSALTASNAVDPTYRGTVHFTSSDGGATLPADYTFTATDNGVHTFTNNVTLVRAGSQTVTATDTGNVNITGSATVTVNAAAASTFVVSGFPSPVTAGSAGTFSVTARDSFGNTATGYSGTVHFSSSDGQAVLPVNATLTNGTGSFTATLKTAGTQSLTASDTVTVSITGSQTGIIVNPAAASTLIVAGFPSSVTAGSAGSFTVTAKDPFGNTVTGYTGTVHFSSSDGQAVLPANTTLTNGTRSFSATLKTAGTQSLTATDTVTASITGSQTGIIVNPAAASTFVVGGFPSPITAGTVGTFAVTAKDAFGNTATGYTGTVHFTSSDGQAVLPANATLTSGTGSFSATLKTAGTQSLTATDTVTASITGTQGGILVNPAAVSTLVVAGFPSSVTAGVAGSFTVTARDSFGNTATGYAGTVHFTSSDGQAVLPANATLTSGTGSFSATLKTAGSQSLTAADTVTASITGSQTGITVNAAAASTFIVAGFPSPVTAGVAGNFTVTAKDPFGNTATGYTGTVHFSSSDGQAALPANATLSSGTGSFSATLKTVGTQSLSATDTVTAGITGTQAGITVNPAAASTLIVVGFPSPVTAGSAGSFTVTARDAFGNTATGYTGTVHFTSSDGQAVLPADSTLSAGTGSFSATLKTAGTQSVTATDTVTGSITGSQAGITVNPAAATALIVVGFPSPVTAGSAGSFTVTAKDPFGNTASGYAGTVHFTSSDGQAVVPANATLSSGTGSFSATLKTAGTQSLTATDTVTAGITGSQTGITVNAAAASTLIVAGFPFVVTAGSAASFTVTAKDPFGNTATGYTGTVHFTSSDGQAVLPANSTLTSGTGSFSAALKTVGTQSLTATDTVTASITGSQTGISVNPAAASTLIVAGFPSPVTAGISASFTVTARDPFGNTATGYTGTVHFSSSDGQAVLPADATLSAGTGSFSATLKTAGTQSLTATDTVTGSITGSQAGITVNPAAASTLVVGGFPSTVTAGNAGSFAVTAKDSFGNTATGYAGTVHFTSSDGQAVLPANSTLSGGTGSFVATLKTAGTQALTATDTVTGSITGTQAGITVNPAAASSLIVTGFPSPVTAGSAGTFSVTAQDPFGNTATGYAGTVHFSSSDGQAALPADATLTGGTGSFTATLKTAGTQSLSATDTVTASITGTQAGITVNAAAANHLSINAPASASSGTAFSITVTAQDPFNNTATSYGGTIHFTSTDGSASLPANYTFGPGDNGVHTFTNGVTLQSAGLQTITATDTLTSSISGTASINVVAAAQATHLAVGAPATVTAGTAFSITITALDSGNNTVVAYRGTIHFTTSDAGSGVALPADYTFVAADNGVHTFTNGVTLVSAGSQSVSATDTASSTITGSATIGVSPAAASTFVVSGFASPVTAGSAASFTVTAKDAFGNTATGYAGTVHFTSSDGQAVLPANATLTNGTGSFSATLETAGTQSLTATDTTTASITGSQTGITVNAAAASTFIVSGFPAPVTAGSAGTFSVTARDPFGNTATGYTGTVHFSSSDGQAVLPANAMLTNGAGSFTATLKTAGTQSLTATDSVTASITGTQGGILVNPAAASTLIVVGFPSPVTAGSAGTFSVTAKDPYGNTATGYAGIVHFSSSDGQAVLPADATLINGAGSFSATLKTAGTQSLTATDTITASITGSEGGITVNAAAASTFIVSGFPALVTAGTAGTFSVTAKDAFGNTAVGYTGTVHFSSSDGQAVLPANSTLSNGAGSFSASLKTAGTQSLTATDTVTTSITGSQTGIVVNAAAASTLIVAGFPSVVSAGSAGTFTVTAKDPFGNTATGYAGTVHFTSSDGQAVLPVNATLSSGTGSFSATLKTAGTQSLTATDTVTAGITGSQTGITVNAAAASTLIVAGFPFVVTAGSAASFTVTAKDPFGNTATGYTGTVHFTSSDGQAVLPANSTLTSGTGSFGATLKTAGTQSLTATDTVTASITGSQTAITVNPAAASTFIVSGFPATITAGNAGSYTITARDAFGNTATGYAGTVHFTSSDGQAVLPANATLTGGTGSFTATLKTAGTQSLTATDTVTASITGSQTGITVTAAAASTLVVAGFPTPVTAGSAGTFNVTAKDPFGNTATGYTGTVHFSSSDGQATLPANATLSGGAGSFTATLKTAGTRSLTATDTVTASITGSQTGITVNPAVASTFIVSGFPSTITAGNAGSYTITARDAFGNTATGYAGTVHFTSSDGQAVLPANATLTGGAGSFTATLKTAGSQSLTATDTVTASITGSQTGITVTAAAASALVVAGFPTPVTAGSAGSFSVTARDAFGNTATGYTGTVHFTSSDAQATLPANSTLANGTGSFTATLKTAGTRSLTATDTATASITGSQTGIVVNAAAASTFVVAGFPSPVTAGTAGTFTVTATDTFGNTATGYAGTVHFTSSDSQATLPANSTLTNGTGSFSATLRTVGTQSITATDTLTASITGTQTGITVNAASLFVAHINFTKSATDPDGFAGYTVDIGQAYGNRGGGLSFGWNQNDTGNAFDRNNPSAPDERYDTLIQMPKANSTNWKIAVPNGTYTVHLVAGDPNAIDSVYKLNVNGVLTVSGTPTNANHWIEGTVSVTVSNGFITVTNASGFKNNKVDYIDITQTSSPTQLLADKVDPGGPAGDIVQFHPHGHQPAPPTALASQTSLGIAAPTAAHAALRPQALSLQTGLGVAVPGKANAPTRITDQIFGRPAKNDLFSSEVEGLVHWLALKHSHATDLFAEALVS